MASPIKFRITQSSQREFTATLRKYAEYSKRDTATIVNTKAFYIARRATVETPTAEASKILEFIGRDGGAIIGKIINKRRGARGEKGLYGKDMTKAIDVVRAARLRSRAFIKSGWLWAVKALEPFAEKIGGGPRVDRKAKRIGVAKGSAKPATQGWRVRAQIVNTVTAAWDKQEGAAKIAEPALQRAFDAENQSMKDYIERKQRKAAKEAGIKTN
jgi:hypothetical protein